MSSDDLSSIGLTGDRQQLRPYQTVDTVALIGLSEEVQSLALPLPLLPCLATGETMTPSKKADETIHNVLNRHPALVAEHPRAVDVLLVDQQFDGCSRPFRRRRFCHRLGALTADGPPSNSTGYSSHCDRWPLKTHRRCWSMQSIASRPFTHGRLTTASTLPSLASKTARAFRRPLPSH